MNRLMELNDILMFKDLLSVLPISKNTLYKLLKKGDIKSKKCGNQYIITKSNLLSYLKNQPE